MKRHATALIETTCPTASASPATTAEVNGAYWLIAALLASQLGLWLANITPANLTLAILLERLDPANKTRDLSTILGTGALFLTFGALTWGAVSDMTTSKFGRRRPYLLGGLLAGTAAIAAIPFLHSIVGITIAWSIAQFMTKAPVIIMFTSVSEFVPQHLQSRVSGGIGLIFGATTLIGTGIVKLVHDDTIWMFIAPLALALVAVPWFAYLIPDRPASPQEIAATKLDGVLGRFWINPVKRPDFGWLLVNRFLVYMAQATFVGYQVYFLRDHLHQPQADISGLIVKASTLSVSMVLITAPVVGYISDKINRRKIFVMISGALVAVGMGILSQGSELTQYYIGATTVSFGMGIYYGTDLAVAARVLSRSYEVGKGMAMLSLTGTVSQSLAPALAPTILGLGAGSAVGATTSNFPLLFLVAGALALCGAFTIQFVRSVR